MTDTQQLAAESDDPAAAPLDETVPDETAPDETTPRDRDGRPDGWPWLVLVAGIVAVALAFYAWQQARTGTDPDRDRADLRDQAIIEGTAAVETMNSMDHRDVEGGLEAWESVTTGVLHDQLVAISPEERKLLAEQGRTATSRVVQAAITDLTDTTATMLAAVEITVAAEESGAEPAVKRNRFQAHLVLVDGRWKLEDIGQVAVNLR